jgi:hypothetical protein
MIESILARLKKVKGGRGRWTACCPHHQDKSPSLAIRLVEDGRILLHCFGGCSVDEVVGSMGMSINDLFPPIETGPKPAVKPAFYANDLLRIIKFETTIVSLLASDVARGKKLSELDLNRAKLASERIFEAANYANV